MSLHCYNGQDHGRADYVVTDRDEVRRAVCGDCAADAVSSRRWVTVTPLEAVGEEVMAQVRASHQERRLHG